ncbi:MAG: Transporter, CPA2 family [Candidatus Uhrbacteria bacterium GW2011_GWA2_52_8d]|uniref:Transporter, CPA2 family n=1 Tax=Candidatus Uhrbacteria bacterium GW2011_GWA2_52_8d TaxID=1618979 RepID=A0A0G1XPE4_9BACT|nr:MAG: Transporter, CPA2 family [Candidatus Uhrbacteria bacterium GW2011_GWA2_52_8d]
MLGTRLGLDHLSATIIPAVLFSLFVLIGNPLIVMFIMRLLGYHPRTGFLCGTTVAQISEFSFIVIIVGISLGHLSEDVLGRATAVGIITIAASSYLIEHNERIYQSIQGLFRWLEPHTTLSSEERRERPAVKILLFGFHRTGAELLPTIKHMKQSYAVVDFDPVAVRELAQSGEPALYGDVGDENFLEEIKAAKSRLIVSTIPDFVISTSLLMFLHRRKFGGVAVVSVHTDQEAKRCYDLGATYVIIPPVLSGKKFSEMLLKSKTTKRSWEQLTRGGILSRLSR